MTELEYLRHVIKTHEQTIADMLKIQHPVMRDALRYQTLRESQYDIVPVILSDAGGHLGTPDQIDREVDRLIEANQQQYQADNFSHAKEQKAA